MNTLSRTLLFGLLIDVTGVVIVAITVLFATAIDWDFSQSVAIGPLTVSSGVAIVIGFVIGLSGIAIGFTRVMQALRESRPKQ